MRKIVAVFFLLLIAPAVLNAQTGCIEGTVLDTAGSPISGIDVIGINSQANFSIETATDAVGHFFFFHLTPGRYQFATSDEYWKNGHFRRAGDGDSAQEAISELADSDQCSKLTLRRAVRARLHFQVTDQLTGAEISALAEFRLPSSRSSTARFWKGSPTRERELKVPPMAELEVLVFATGYQDSEVLNVGPLDPAEMRTIKMALRPLQTGCITGTVVDDRGTPVANATITPRPMSEHNRASQANTRTDDEGRFRFENLQPGRWSFFVDAAAYLSPPVSGNYVETEVEPTPGCVDATLSLGPKPARLQIAILDARTGKSIRDAEAWAEGDHEGNGGWTLRLFGTPALVPAFQQFTVSARAKGYETKKMTVSPLASDALEKVTIVLDRKKKGSQ